MVWGFVLAHIIVRATALAVVGFFIAFAAQHAEGRLKSLGTYLSYWLYLLAAASVICGLIWPGHGHHCGKHPAMEQGSTMAPSAPAGSSQ